MARHRIHSPSFKKQIVQEYAAGATLNGLARVHDLSRNMIRGGRHGSRWTQPAVGGGHHLRRHCDRLRLPRRHIPMWGGSRARRNCTTKATVDDQQSRRSLG